MTAIFSHQGMDIHFLLPEKAPQKVDVVFGVFQQSSGVVPPWPSGTRALEQREILASWLQKAAAKPLPTKQQPVCRLLDKWSGKSKQQVCFRKSGLPIRATL